MSSRATALLPEHEAAAYAALDARLSKKFNPVGEEESALVQSIVDAEWRLARIPSLEEGIYAVGRREFAALYADERNEDARRQLLDARVFLTYQRQLSNLSVQEARLRRQREKDVQALRELQEARRRDQDSAPGGERLTPLPSPITTPQIKPSLPDRSASANERTLLLDTLCSAADPTPMPY